MGIFERLFDVVRANTTPLDAQSDAFGIDDPIGPWPDVDDERPSPAPSELVARWYALLELPVGADLEAVRGSYRRLMFRFHPDKFASDPDKQRMATDLSRGLTTAYRGLRAHLDDS